MWINVEAFTVPPISKYKIEYHLIIDLNQADSHLENMKISQV
jgi:hypothetical protein